MGCEINSLSNTAQKAARSSSCLAVLSQLVTGENNLRTMRNPVIENLMNVLLLITASHCLVIRGSLDTNAEDKP